MNWKSAWQHLLLVTLVLAATAILVAQEAKVKINVYPPESAIFVDNKTKVDGSANIKVTPGTHTITVYNYGFAAQTREVSLNAGKNPSIDFKLERAGGPVSGPWGRIQIEDAKDAAVFLNGETPGYLVGHSDMFNNNWIWTQALVVPAGKYQVTVVKHDGAKIWSGEVNVEANKRVIIHTKSGQLTVKDWPQGANRPATPRFTAGIATASVVVAPVTATFAAAPTQINCGDTTRLNWSTQDAVDSTLTANSASMGEIPVSGERAEQPKQTTAYQFQTTGPGGVVSSAATVDVNTAVQANMGAAPAEVRYHRMGEKVIEHTPTNLNWTAANADAASLDPLGTVATNGEQSVKPVPKQTNDGPVDENATYTFMAKNICGGSDTKTASVHITGMIEPVPEVPLASVFFPTGYPEASHPEIGLVRSQHDVLAKTAEGMTQTPESRSRPMPTRAIRRPRTTLSASGAPIASRHA
jgi:hypothetical protein